MWDYEKSSGMGQVDAAAGPVGSVLAGELVGARGTCGDLYEMEASSACQVSLGSWPGNGLQRIYGFESQLCLFLLGDLEQII